MNELEKNPGINELVNLLTEKRDLYNQMISHNKEFEEVKTLFTEIRELEKLIQVKQTNN